MGLAIFALAVSVSCSVYNETRSGNREREEGEIIGQVASVAFGPDGRLWRARPTSSSVLVDYSDDLGRSFSKPVSANTSSKRISASREDRPTLGFDNQGGVYVYFKADGVIPRSAYISVSKDGDGHFREPVLVSDHAKRFKHYQGVIAASKDYSRIFTFWSDERHGDEIAGNALYYAPVEFVDTIKMPNALVKQAICECCRLAVDFDRDNNPVVLVRTLYKGGERDHGLFFRGSPDSWIERRVTHDHWRINACPEHGPALSIGPDERYHLVWFTHGDLRQGLFYAYSDNQGATLSPPRPIGERLFLPGHADVLALAKQVVLAWQEFDGENTIIKISYSVDRGESWSPDKIVVKTSETADYPFLISNGDRIFVSFNSKVSGYQLIPIGFSE